MRGTCHQARPLIEERIEDALMERIEAYPARLGAVRGRDTRR